MKYFYTIIGMILGGFLSWTVNGSVAWGIFHTIIGWLYTLYWLFAYGFPTHFQPIKDYLA